MYLRCCHIVAFKDSIHHICQRPTEELYYSIHHDQLKNTTLNLFLKCSRCLNDKSER